MRRQRTGFPAATDFSGVELGLDVVSMMLRLGLVLDRQNNRVIGLLGLGVGI